MALLVAPPTRHYRVVLGLVRLYCRFLDAAASSHDSDELQPWATHPSDTSHETVRASVLFDAIVGCPSARLATCVRARRPSGAVHHFNWIAESSRRSQTHQEKPQQLGRQALDADAAGAEQLSMVVSEGCIVSVERHGCHSHSYVRNGTHTRPILHAPC